MDECQEKMDNCHLHARCDNTVGSYECLCNDGFTGNGRFCAGTEIFFCECSLRPSALAASKLYSYETLIVRSSIPMLKISISKFIEILRVMSSRNKLTTAILSLAAPALWAHLDVPVKPVLLEMDKIVQVLLRKYCHIKTYLS